MNKQRTIRMWHGDLPDRNKAILNAIAAPQLDRSWIYTGTLDEFEIRWGGVWCVIDGDIFVTVHGWGAR